MEDSPPPLPVGEDVSPSPDLGAEEEEEAEEEDAPQEQPGQQEKQQQQEPQATAAKAIDVVELDSSSSDGEPEDAPARPSKGLRSNRSTVWTGGRPGAEEGDEGGGGPGVLSAVALARVRALMQHGGALSAGSGAAELWDGGAPVLTGAYKRKRRVAAMAALSVALCMMEQQLPSGQQPQQRTAPGSHRPHHHLHPRLATPASGQGQGRRRTHPHLPAGVLARARQREQQGPMRIVPPTGMAAAAAVQGLGGGRQAAGKRVRAGLGMGFVYRSVVQFPATVPGVEDGCWERLDRPDHDQGVPGLVKGRQGSTVVAAAAVVGAGLPGPDIHQQWSATGTAAPQQGTLAIAQPPAGVVQQGHEGQGDPQAAAAAAGGVPAMAQQQQQQEDMDLLAAFDEAGQQGGGEGEAGLAMEVDGDAGPGGQDPAPPEQQAAADNLEEEAEGEADEGMGAAAALPPPSPDWEDI